MTSFLVVAASLLRCTGPAAPDLANTQIEGYRPIWFELNQKYEAGDKYSGALGTYTAKHIPLAVYAPEVDKTFFVYGGTTDADSRHLLCMIGEFDHATGMVSKPTVVCDKQGVDDPHDNPSLMLDAQGYVWVFVSGRGTSRPGYKYKSLKPYRIDKFMRVSEEEMTYPQIALMDHGFFLFFTKYTGKRQLYYATSADGTSWSEDRKLAAIVETGAEFSGHYQISKAYDGKTIGTFFNRHPNGDVDRRTDLYYLQSTDFGQSWTNVEGIAVDLPVTTTSNSALAIDYAVQGKNIYVKDMGYNARGHPACLYIRSNGHRPGSGSAPYEWCLTRWNGQTWHTSLVTTSDHNYDMGSLFINGENWTIVGPTEEGAQDWAVGGELAIWTSNDTGANWIRDRRLTRNSAVSHAYVRRPLNYRKPFCFFWASGHAHYFSKSELYFGNFAGEVWKLPYHMKEDYERAQKMTTQL